MVNTEIFWLLICQINIWTVNCERAATSIFDWWIVVLKEAVQFFVSETIRTPPPCQVFYQPEDQTLFTLCVLILTQKLCVNIYVYICVYIPYTSSVIGRIYNGSVIQYWRSCTPSRSIGECAVPDLNAILCFLWFTNCVLLFDNNLILGCLWHYVFV